MSIETIFILSLLLESCLLGLIAATSYRAWLISVRTAFAQIGREFCIFNLVTFTGIVLWWDLFYPGVQFPIAIRELVTFPTLLIGIISYVSIAMDIEGKYSGIESIRHEIAKYEMRVQGLQDLLKMSEEDLQIATSENDLLKQRLEKRERNSVSSSILMAQLQTQSVQITELSNKLKAIGVSADNAYEVANNSKQTLIDYRKEGIEESRIIAEKQKKKDDFTDAKLDNIEKTSSENLTVSKDINTKLKLNGK